VTALTVTGQPGGPGRPLTAGVTLDTTGRGGLNLLQAEYWFDTVGLPGGVGSHAINGVNTSVTTQNLSSTGLDLTGLTSGSHILYVRGSDASGAWGPVRALSVRLDVDGPVVTGIVLSATNVNGGSNLTFSATVDDTTTGGSNVAGTTCTPDLNATTCGARFRVTDSTGAIVLSQTALKTNGPRRVAATSGVIPAAAIASLADGTYTLWIEGKDVLGQWGAPNGDTTFTVDRTAPETQLVSVKPAYTNGQTGNPSQPGTIAVTADIVDRLVGGVNSPISVVEMYLNPSPLPPTGSISGIQMSYTGPGAAAGSSRYLANMPLSWVGGFADGSIIKVVVVAMDQAGNRADGTGVGSSTNLTIDKTAPTISGTLTQGNYPNDGTATLTVDVADGTGSSGTNLVEWWIGVDPGVGNGHALALTGGQTTFTLASLTPSLTNGGPLAVSVRARDAANNLRVVVVSATMKPVQVFSDGFESATLPGSWTSRTPTTGTSLTASPTTPLAGSRSLVAATTGTATAFVTKDVTGILPPVGAAFSAHFLFAPGTTATGTGSNNVTVFAGSTTSLGANVMQVRYLRQGSAVRFALCVNGTAVCTTTAAQTVAAATTYTVKVDYTAGGTSTLSVTAGAQSWTASAASGTTAQTIGFAKLGVVAKSASFSASFKFDAFASARAPF
jgi:hypothetical protein